VTEIINCKTDKIWWLTGLQQTHGRDKTVTKLHQISPETQAQEQTLAVSCLNTQPIHTNLSKTLYPTFLHGLVVFVDFYVVFNTDNCLDISFSCAMLFICNCVYVSFYCPNPAFVCHISINVRMQYYECDILHANVLITTITQWRINALRRTGSPTKSQPSVYHQRKTSDKAQQA